MLEPYEGKLSCTVLRGEGGSNALDLPDILTTTMVQLLGTNGVQKNAGTVLTIGPLMALTTTI